MKIGVDTSGMAKLKDAVQKRILKKAMRAGAKLIIAAVRAAVPVATGSLKKSITSKVDSPKGSLTAYAIVGPRSKWEKTVKGVRRVPSRYAHLTLRKHDWLSSAESATATAALATMQAVIASEVEAELGK